MVCVTETQLSCEIVDNEFCPRAILFTEETVVTGEGVLLAINSRVLSKQVYVLVDVPVDTEAVIVQLSLSIPLFV